MCLLASHPNHQPSGLYSSPLLLFGVSPDTSDAAQHLVFLHLFVFLHIVLGFFYLVYCNFT
jgi:hypothetical protein